MYHTITWLTLALLPSSLLAVPVPQKPKPPNPKQFSKAIEELASGQRKLDTLRVQVTWAGDASQLSADIYGSGIGILNRQQQFTLPKATLERMVKRLHEAQFGSLKKQFGGFDRPGREGPVRGGPARGGPVRGAPEVLKGSVTVTIAGVSKSVTQLGGGEQSETLAQLAHNLLTLCSESAKNGVSATDLKDGLDKVRTGKLHPLTLSIMVHRLIQKPNVEGERFLFRLEGDTITTRTNTPGKGYGPEIRQVLSQKELAEVAKLLLDNDVGSLPINVWAEHYTDLRVSVLDKERSTQARQFARMTPKTHGERQHQFDRIYEGLVQLHRRVMKEGEPIQLPLP